MNPSTWCHYFLENLQTQSQHSAHLDHPFEPDWLSLSNSKADTLDASCEWIHSTISGLPDPIVTDYSYDFMMTSM